MDSPRGTTMNSAPNDYGLWGLVFLNSVIFLGFAYSFFKPANLRDWRSFSAYGAFIVALFAEMYGFPLTIYLLSGWLGTKFPGVNLLEHDAGHLWWLITGRHGNPHFGALHVLSFAFIFAGFTLLSKAWHVLYHAQRRHELAKAGPYRLVRHPQYIGFVAIMFGFLLQWPTLLTLGMFPVLVVTYVRLAISEERDSEMAFGDAWREYAKTTPRFVPNFFKASHARPASGH
ncbi:protein-S-isoprenylcysteine O-methyltransferase Ste14 [Variovorax beijingensis]|uniref:Protein-S-isoprenylcysteine O-methyltransferase Ste14 n=2 Tax=Variovorax beijingensis TaxID=2496117 RepID=A0A561BB63_9BURK|nr:protein-S-isoprenylcysteine O-methyltransferase Ste14 [Variovorax beijingensis]